MQNNPFIVGNPVRPRDFLDRKRELRRSSSRIRTGQSLAVIGEPRSGKTSLLLYLSAPEMRRPLYGEAGERLLFSYLDAQTLGSRFDQARFWELALRPLRERAEAPGSDPALLQAYVTCQGEGFGNFVLERLLAQAQQAGWRLVLMLDEFDVLLHHEALRSIELFGGLRSLASRYPSLTLVIASRLPLERLNRETQALSRSGSPFFNFLTPIPLRAFPDVAVGRLLRRGDGYFTPADRRYLREIGGGHPYLLQAAASALWEAYAEGVEDAVARRAEAGEYFYEQAAPALTDIWRYWTPDKQKALTAIGLAHLSSPALGGREFRVERLIEALDSLRPEIRDLKKQGFIAEDDGVPGGWRIRPGALLWWLADEIVRLARDDTPFEEWLLAQEWQGQLTKEEKDKLRSVGRKLGSWLEGGVTTLIKATAEGAAKGLTGK